MVDRVRDSVVSIESRGGFGAGVVWDSKGWIVTNDHVVQRSESRVTFQDGSNEIGRVLARDPAHDLALVSVPNIVGFAIERGDARTLRPGDALLAVGHPLGLRDAASFGIVSGTGGVNWMGRPASELLQADLRLAPGNSGGPVVNASGQLVGIASMVLSPGIALAVPIQIVHAFVREVEAKLAA